MKKIVSLLFCALLFLISTTKISAEEIKHGNLVTDTTTIEEDFKLLGLSIDDYYKPVYNYDKFYVIGMSEAYIDEENYDIQTYFYLYAPIRYYRDKEDYIEAVATFSLTYESKNANVLSSNNDELLDYSVDHCLFKVKGFSYKYTATNEIKILKIEHSNTRGLYISSDSNFKATANHSKLNGFNVELNFNSTLIIDDYGVDIVEIKSESNWNNTFGMIPIFTFHKDFKRGRAYFYNFNFPDNIKPDSIEYAKFIYNKTDYFKNRQNETEVLKEKKGEIHEYTPGTKKIKIDSESCELEFQTFVLGNRIEKKEFGYLEFSEEDKKKYDVDCSILLDIFLDQYKTYRVYKTLPGMVGGGMWVYESEEWYSELDKIEMLELWYEKDSVLYQCQVVNKPVDKDDITHSNPDAPESLWEKFLKWFQENFPFSAFLIIGVPIVLIVIAIFCPHLYSLIFNYIIAAGQLIIKIITWIFKGVIFILTLPFRLIFTLIKKIFKRE